jgi:hypothetical protein
VAEIRLIRGLAWAYIHLLLRIPVLGPGLQHVVRSFSGRLMAGDLRRLHDVLADTELDGRYWVWAGLLLGWAREGRLLRHDLRDADFGVLAEDLPRLEAALPALGAAGFRLEERAVANDGRVTFVRFCRRPRWHRTVFEFFFFDVVDDQLRYFIHKWLADRPLEVEFRLPRQELVPFAFLGRTWLRHADAELELAANYGDWRTPQQSWSWFRDDRAFHSSRVWTRPDG